MFEAKQLSIGYANKKTILSDLNFELNTGELVAIIGRNGAGKTTLLKTLTQALPPLAGQVWLGGKAAKSYTTQALAKKISIVNTERIRIPYLAVSDFLALGRFPHTNFRGQLQTHDKVVIASAIQAISLQDLLPKNLEELSDGELQKVLIARALVQDTPIILLDEPTTHLDLIHRFQVLRLLKKLTLSSKKTIVFSTHEVELALDLADKIMLITKDSQLVIDTPKALIEGGHIHRNFEQEGVFFDTDILRFRYKM